MVLDSKIASVREALGIGDLHDWADHTPREILSIEGVGPVTLDHIRLYLSGHETTLKNDGTPAYWKKNLGSLRMAQQMSSADQLEAAPFTVLVDSMEQQPFSFENLTGPTGKPVAVPTKWKALGIREGRYYQPMGDYSIEGFESLIHLERKSVTDCQSTVLAFGGRRERFEHQLAVFDGLPWSAVIVEGTLADVVRTVQAHGKKPVEELRKIVFHTLMAWQMDYRTPWFFCESRRMAETVAWRTMVRFWQKSREKDRQSRKQEMGIQ
jgi:hypothetical protein